MKTIPELENYFLHDLPELLKSVSGSEQALWGSMNVKQMLEHLALPFMLARGMKTVELTTPADKVVRIKQLMLLTDKPMPKGFDNPILSAELKQERTENIAKAIVELHDEVKNFMNYFSDKEATHATRHNIFGELNYHEWLWFHYKHVLHHLAQFGIVPYQEKVV
jgi:oxepin-CoA hydrolase/3-oxo-5,6-dehydrosuberyl-CoA semialdehyde dehydrogenase